MSEERTANNNYSAVYNLDDKSNKYTTWVNTKRPDQDWIGHASLYLLPLNAGLKVTL